MSILKKKMLDSYKDGQVPGRAQILPLCDALMKSSPESLVVSIQGR